MTSAGLAATFRLHTGTRISVGHRCQSTCAGTDSNTARGTTSMCTDCGTVCLCTACVCIAHGNACLWTAHGIACLSTAQVTYDATSSRYALLQRLLLRLPDVRPRDLLGPGSRERERVRWRGSTRWRPKRITESSRDAGRRSLILWGRVYVFFQDW